MINERVIYDFDVSKNILYINTRDFFVASIDIRIRLDLKRFQNDDFSFFETFN